MKEELSWCDNQQIYCISLDALSLISLIAFSLYAIITRKVYLIESQAPLFEKTQQRSSAQSYSYIMKYLTTQFIQVGLLANNLIQTILWVATKKMSFYFGSLFAIDSLFWLTCIYILYVDYSQLKKISKILKVAWLIQLINVSVVFLSIISYYNIEENVQQYYNDQIELKYQLNNHIFDQIAIIILNVIGALMNSYTYQGKVRESDQQSLQKSDYVFQQSTKKQRPSFIEKLTDNEVFLQKHTEDIQKEDPIIQDNSSQVQDDSLLIYMENDSQTTSSDFLQFNPFQEKVQGQNQANIQIQDEFPSIIEGSFDDFRVFEIKIEGFEEIQKFGKKTLVYYIVSKSSSGERQARRSYSEFKTLYNAMVKSYPYTTFPQFPEKKKSSEMLSRTELTNRGQQFETILKFCAYKGFINDIYKNFIQEANVQRKLSNEKERGEDKVKDYVKEIYEDKERQKTITEESFDEMIKNRQNSQSIKKALDQLKNSPITVNQLQLDDIEIVEKSNDFEFKITETQMINTTIYYKLESYYNGMVAATVQRRYNDFKMLQKVLSEKYNIVQNLPDEPSTDFKSEGTIEEIKTNFRRQRLQIYINELYGQKKIRTEAKFKNFLGI